MQGTESLTLAYLLVDQLHVVSDLGVLVDDRTADHAPRADAQRWLRALRTRACRLGRCV